MAITIQQNIEIKLTPEHLAQLFTEMDNVEQCRFFNHLGKLVGLWSQPLEFQLAEIESCGRLDNDGKNVLTTMSQMFATHDIVALLDACQTVVNTYETDGFEGMRNRDHVFNDICKKALKPIKKQ